MDRIEWAAKRFIEANRKTFTLPFSEFVRKRAQVDPLEAAHRVRNRRQQPK